MIWGIVVANPEGAVNYHNLGLVERTQHGGETGTVTVLPCVIIDVDMIEHYQEVELNPFLEAMRCVRYGRRAPPCVIYGRGPYAPHQGIWILPRVNRIFPYPFYLHALLPLNMSHFCLLLSLSHLPLFEVGSVFLLLFFRFPGCCVHPSPWTRIPEHR